MAASTSSAMQFIRACRPSFRNDNDKAAFVIHASFMAANYIPHATGPANADDVFTSTSTENEAGIDGWNHSDEDDYAFVYSNPNISPKKVLVKCLVLNGKLLADATREGDSDLLHLEFAVADYVVKGSKNGNYSSMYKDLEKLEKIIDDAILAKLKGSLSSDVIKPSSEEIFPGREESVEPDDDDPDQPYYPAPPPSGPYSPFLPYSPYGSPFHPHGPPGFLPIIGDPTVGRHRFGPRRPGNHPDLEPFRDDSDLP